ncbi:LCP family protein [Candidatus Saccharibacteria bacterium]|nr:LCP family protein [Candidatus Saccharibacteria bacterium]
MDRSKRTRQGASIDGFVRRTPSTAPKKRVDLNKAKAKNRPEGFTRRQAAQRLEFTGDTWSDDNTLQIESAREDAKQMKTEDTKPRWWQFKKRRQAKAQKEQDKQSKKRKIKRYALACGVIALLIGGFLGWKFLSTSSKVFDGNVLGLLTTTKLKGEDEGRVNIVLAGTSEDDPGHDGATLTDSIMLASIDTKNNTAFTTSIPRDLWVEYGEQCSAGYEGKINNAYQCGEANEFSEPGYPKGGMGLLSKVISETFDIPIHYYGKINYTAFRDAVDAVGGIEIKVESDDPRGIYDPNIQPKDGGPVRLKNGVQKLDGITALALARSRNVAGGYGLSRGDFDRTMYQRKMLIALKDKALSVGVLSNPSKIGSLLDAAGDNVDTNFNTSELRRLYDLSKKIKSNNISSIDLSDPEEGLLTTGMYNGQSIVRPSAGIKDYSELQTYLKRLMSTDPLVKEEATVVILNGTDSAGLAQKYADVFAEKGISVLVVSNASTNRGENIVIDIAGDNPKTKAYFEKRLKTSATTDTTSQPEGSQYNADFVVILGAPSIGQLSN